MVQLVQNGGSVGSFRSTGFASIFFPSRFEVGDVQLINVWKRVLLTKGERENKV